MTDAEMLAAVSEYGGVRTAGRALGIPESTIRMRLKRGLSKVLTYDDAQQEFTFTSNRPLRPSERTVNPERVRNFILTSAQDSSKVHADFWQCLQVYADWLEDCEIIVAGFTYNKKLFEDHDTRSAKVGFAPEVSAFLAFEPVNIGDGLVFCAEQNTLPTAVTPMSGFDAYTRKRWGVFPHPKVHLKSIPTMKGAVAKQQMTTGAVTLPNYIRKKAGIKASFNHICGAVLAELHPDGSWYCRHLLATSLDDGSFYDLDCHITREGVTDGHRVEAISYGDIHHEKLDPTVAMATWGYDVKTQRVPDPEFPSLVNFLRPNFGFYHDLSDFSPRNHHNIKDPHFRYAMHRNGTDNVEAALRGSAVFCKETGRQHPDYQIIIVQSNHDNALVKWLKEADYKSDPENALFFLRTQTRYYEYLDKGVSAPPVFEEVLRNNGCPRDIVFVSEDEPFTICGDIECGMHGHLGANGARATPMAFTKMGPKSITGHTHSPMIYDGAYVNGVSGSLDMGYNKGLSSWAHAHTIVYPNGKRTILTMMNGRFYA